MAQTQASRLDPNVLSRLCDLGEPLGTREPCRKLLKSHREGRVTTKHESITLRAKFVFIETLVLGDHVNYGLVV